MFAATAVKELTLQFAECFNNKDAEGIRTLLAEDFVLYDPVLKCVRGRENGAKVFQKQLSETERVAYEVLHAYEEGDTGILEFKITMDQEVFEGVDFLRWEEGKMVELRCYFSPPASTHHEELKPLSEEAKSFVGGEIYEHYRGKRYKILSVGRSEATLEECIVYQALYGDRDVWVRPLRMFLEKVVVEGESQPRFKRVQ